MGKVLKLIALGLVILVGVSLYLCPCLLRDPEVPQLPEHRWWGSGKEPPQAANAKIESRPFRIQVEDSVLQDLKRRLQNTRLSPPLEGVAFQYGYNTNHLKTVLDYWQNKYDWRKEESRLNQFPQFLAKIEGIDVHYIRATPSVKDPKVKVLPLLMVHGWPGSVAEFYKIIPLLTSPVSGVAFEVICPSIPGYGFSEAPHHPGYTIVDAARTFKKLMESLGYQKFYAQGGNWGASIVTKLAIHYPEKLYGVHVNMGLLKMGLSDILKYLAGFVAPSLVIKEDRQYNIYPPGAFFSKMLQETGYMHIQATKPDTVGVGLGDSPAGLAAYILEKFSSWTDMENREKKDGDLFKKFTTDELLTNVMVYWVTNSITSSVRLYKESLSDHKISFDKYPVHVPSGIAVFPNDIMTIPRFLLCSRYRKLMTFSHPAPGGHFAAMEEPQLVAQDIRTFVSATEEHLEQEEQRREALKRQQQQKEKEKAAKKDL